MGIILAVSPFVQAKAESAQAAHEKSEDIPEEYQVMRDAVPTDSPIVIELYTSSDCSSCIYTDRVLYDATKDKQVIALSCHVKDATSMSLEGESEEVSEESTLDPCVFRHWAFKGQRRGESTLAMPTFYFNGSYRMYGSHLRLFNSMLRRYHYAPPNNVQEAMMRWKDKDTISIHLPQKRKTAAKINASVWLVRYKDMAVERMDKGANAGRVLRFSNVIQDITHIAKWHGTARVVDVDVTPPQGGKERGGYAVLVAEHLGTPYLVAGKISDYPVASDIEEEVQKRARAKESAESKPTVIPSDNKPVNTTPNLR